MNRTQTSQQSFARFYLEKVAISEGCGCAEMVIRRDEPKIRADHGLRELWHALQERWRGAKPATARQDGDDKA